MIKYEIYKDNFECATSASRFKIPSFSADDIWYEYERKGWRYPELVESFDNEAEARAAFENYKKDASTALCSGFSSYFLDCVVIYLDENEYDNESGEIDCGNTIDNAAEPFIALNERFAMYEFNRASFGEHPPKNWVIIANDLNDYLDDRTSWETSVEQGKWEAAQIWKEYINGELPDVEEQEF